MSVIAPTVAPAFAPGFRLRFDRVRDAWVVLGPERMFELDEPAVEILKLVDGQATFAAIIDVLAARFAAPRDEIAGDVAEMLTDLAVRGAIRL